MKDVIMYSTEWCSDCKRTERIFKEKGVAFKKIDIDKDEEASQQVIKLANGKRIIPTLVITEEHSSKVMINPSPSELSKEFGFVL